MPTNNAITELIKELQSLNNDPSNKNTPVYNQTRELIISSIRTTRTLDHKALDEIARLNDHKIADEAPQQFRLNDLLHFLY